MTLQIVINALDPERAAPVTCTIRPIQAQLGRQQDSMGMARRYSEMCPSTSH